MKHPWCGHSQTTLRGVLCLLAFLSRYSTKQLPVKRSDTRPRAALTSAVVFAKIPGEKKKISNRKKRCHDDFYLNLFQLLRLAKQLHKTVYYRHSNNCANFQTHPKRRFSVHYHLFTWNASQADTIPDAYSQNNSTGLEWNKDWNVPDGQITKGEREKKLAYLGGSTTQRLQVTVTGTFLNDQKSLFFEKQELSTFAFNTENAENSFSLCLWRGLHRVIKSSVKAEALNECWDRN